MYSENFRVSSCSLVTAYNWNDDKNDSKNDFYFRNAKSLLKFEARCYYSPILLNLDSRALSSVDTVSIAYVSLLMHCSD